MAWPSRRLTGFMTPKVVAVEVILDGISFPHHDRLYPQTVSQNNPPFKLLL